mmetsp:Transcript_31008/g.66014  ORF Transcript_31008/g.66014 Transcript_31008/m.66014 type:complete len:166 (-) Transcript_31008:56-553(-)|eukprot:CAMPEP_0172551268 /NCGR_PEP_ID=MMETSP1067-20121228/37324_1 /TAXON_ID=265564 ORGANISM="Thalassiosira punctigera, Strain Tpunct2005C2" /NCGR_SAMPLE_ID=MMETSP1067 /ASSEMBLY_ACC=CAM_ASM_000444 /LENGTH=165 /DNA_ID=CAMNT_0013339033 /DNA_START=67 /DNA_END=564 /DNA_ORIENTATION=-
MPAPVAVDPTPVLLTGLGAALSLFLAGGGAAYATAHASVFAIRHRDLMAMVPVVQAGVLAVYGIIIGYKLSAKMTADDVAISDADGYKFLCAGLSVGLACLASGYGMGNYLSQLNESEYYFVRRGKKDEKENASKKFSFVTFVLCLIYLEAIGLYGLIVALFLTG